MVILSCTVEQNPCPPGSQVWVSLAEATNPALVGLTPEFVARAVAVGFAFVLGSFLLGWGLSLALGLIRKL